MKAKFLRHEYTWSKQPIGGTIGLGLVSSTIPKDKVQVREIEKMASMAEADRESGQEVELLMHNKQVGFVKMTVKPVPAAEDQRKNKRVYLYQCEEKDITDPDVYCMPQGSWESTEDSYLPMVALEEEWEEAKDILVKYGLINRLPDLFRAVFWCVFRGGKNLAFLTDWQREDYEAKAREIMYAIHKVLPANLRKNAGYASYGCGSNQNSSFFFTGEQTEGDSFHVSTLEYIRVKGQEDALDHFFYENLAMIYWENESLYHAFLEKMDQMIGERQIDKNLLREVQWSFLPFCLSHGMDIPSFEDIMKLIPQLFYGASDSKLLADVETNLMEYYHTDSWSSERCINYMNVLAGGMTKKGERRSIEEIHWCLDTFAKDHKKMARDYFYNLKQTKNKVFTRLLSIYFEEKDSFYQEYQEDSCKNLLSMKQCIEELDQMAISDALKDQWMIRGIEILNENVFMTKNYKIFTDISRKLRRESQWVKILKGFLQQLAERCENFDEEQLESACSIETIFEKLTETKGPGPLKIEKEKRNVSKINPDNLPVTAIQSPQEKGEDAMESENEVYRTIEEKEEESGNSATFFLCSFPYGFLTGCILYLLNYALVIGHWKISLGVGGMWLILMLNYMNESLRRRDGFHLWKAIGLCIVEGYIIQVIAWVFLPKEYRVYFFLALGILMALIQFIQMILLSRKNRLQNEEIE